MKRILVTGSNGQLGSEIRLLAPQYPQFEFDFTDVAELDITDAQAVERHISQNQTGLIINCAAYTAVDRAEDDEALCQRINALAPKILGEAAAKHGIGVLHVSTDYVFDGTSCRPYREEDPTSPRSVYGRTKLEGERALTGACSNAVVVRTAWLYSEFGNNFVKTMLRLGREKDALGVIFDQVGTPTYARDLAAALLLIADKVLSQGFGAYAGTYHFTNEGVCSWYDFTLKIHQMAGIGSCRIRPIKSEEYPAKAPRPHYSVLDKSKIKSVFGLEIRHWEPALAECMTLLA